MAAPTAESNLPPAAMLFSESNTRFVCEVAPDHAANFESELKGIPHSRIGAVREDARLHINAGKAASIKANINELKEAWQKSLRW
jgi:phosphoribosylformylglycinamidine synthase